MKPPASQMPLTLLKDLQTADRSMLQLTLHLGQYPEDKVALDQYNELSQARQNTRTKAEAAFGPMRSYHTSLIDKHWDWHQAN
ncbi:spore coat protein CotJB [Gorillibacterium timonense]|uniref:spore coat protein CotJB n=1 Tax=Gorillibacterium timonense TaxID=1689269 RepID=UPI00071CC8AF|nr:spore coat protein CotJB [Gorillibacterium timonense]